jgi:hypothetical protein
LYANSCSPSPTAYLRGIKLKKLSGNHAGPVGDAAELRFTIPALVLMDVVENPCPSPNY